jgi:hypothetical protein
MRRIIIGTAAFIVMMACIAFGHATYVGYSGAPGASGRCASSCHGAGGGTIQVSGFPTAYVSGQIYTINISHSGGTTIRQFNGSCRIGTGSQNAGVIGAGTRTVTYNTSGETNGIHLTAINQDSCTFRWTAPPAGTGTVRLFIAGQQGSSSGANSTLTLSATEQITGIDGADETSRDFSISNNYPNPFNAQTTIQYDLSRQSTVSIEIYDILGHRIDVFANEKQNAGRHSVIWDSNGRASGIYFYKIDTGDLAETKRMLLLK